MSTSGPCSNGTNSSTCSKKGYGYTTNTCPSGCPNTTNSCGSNSCGTKGYGIQTNFTCLYTSCSNGAKTSGWKSNGTNSCGTNSNST